MGGGDLNLKKSWHPQTMRNQEKVWKAEQAKNAEDKKMGELRKEIQEEKNRSDLKRIGESSGILPKSDDKKLEWMYKSSSELVNREEYLLGRPIDKAFETLEAEEKQKEKGIIGVKVPVNHVEHECVPFSIRAYRNVDTTEQVDLQRKTLEDPLMLIKQKEMETRRKILENPVKLKEIHRILKTERATGGKSADCERIRRKVKRSKKKKERKSESTSTDSSDDELDAILQKRYKKVKGFLNEDCKVGPGLDLGKFLDEKYRKISKELDKAARKKKKNKKRVKRHRSTSQSSGESGSRSINRSSTTKIDTRHRRDMPHSNNRHSEKNNDYHRPDNEGRKQSTHVRSTSHRSHEGERSRNHSRDSRVKRPEECSRAPPRKERLTEEEREKRLKDMMANAAWRDEERSRYMKNYRNSHKQEEESHKSRDFDKGFINKQLRDALSVQNSIESRIKSNVNNIQRTSAAMNSNFAKK